MKKLLPFILFATGVVAAFSQTTYTVNTLADTPDYNINDNICADGEGNCSLRAAINNANKASNKDIIAFNIPGTAPFTLVLAADADLPTINYPVIIDGRTQPGYAIANTPVIEIDGSDLSINKSGLQLVGLANNSEIYGLSIGGFQRIEVNPYSGGFGIDVQTQNNIIQSNYIGLKPDGTTSNPNYWGVFFSESGNNTVGGTLANQGNVVSGNLSGGVTFQGIACSNNTVQGNLLGTDATGLLPRGNQFNLQFINAPNNIVGGNTPQARNIISAGVNVRTAVEDGTGISITGVNSTNITITGNYIGTDITGTAALPNTRGGILMLFGANNITIGGDGPGEGNVISGNGYYSSGAPFFGGIYLQGSGANPVVSNTIIGNKIGVDATGNVALPNSTGIFILAEGNNNTIGGTTPNSRNIISGNTLDGISIASTGKNNQIIGNYIGTNVSGTTAIPNDYGIYSEGGNNSIGGATPNSRNIISGNSVGVFFTGSASTGCSVKGNYIGLNALGNAAVPNDIGVLSSSSSTNIVIGGANVSDRNIISGNFDKGLSLSGTLHTIRNNYIGLNPAGDGVIKNENEGLKLSGIVTNTQVSENVISGNGTSQGTARNVFFSGADGARFFSNIVGILPDGITGVSNPGPGILMFNSSNNIIGGDSEIKGNTIAGNTFKGISLVLACNNNIFDNNKIGVGTDGTTSIGNGVSGIEISGTIVGGTISNNIIANSPKGVFLNPSSGIATQISISQNSIYNNAIIGIDLGGTSANDVDDADTGVNNLQNTPEITAVIDVGDDALEVLYAVPSSVSNSAYPMVVEFFGAVNGQGKIFIESDIYNAPGDKNVTLNLPTGSDLSDYINIVATATDANGNTSEFGITTGVVLNVSQFENHTLKIYPNPVSDRLFIQSPYSGSYNLEVMNVLGQLVLTKKDDLSSASLEVANLKNGIYFLKIVSENGNSQTLKFIKN